MGLAPPFTIRIDSCNRVAHVMLCGESDMAAIPILQDRLASVEGDSVSTIMLDLRELTFLDSSTIHAFVRARDRVNAHGNRLIVVGASPGARRLFELTGTQFLLNDPGTADVLDRFTGVTSREPQSVASQERADV